ncbi:4-phosphoerythronate dehydrogenase [Corallincola luteus]|uniref:Erythronate-4-phosphate dehydrogenase n=1 Tax=Corallincola luteus TaxID=1775177 RepID=A0ABY2AJX6_9GAMM|nr:4-phosphoerythronate dehydrogenase [Corallincola luteus]TCI01635.1 4-phosphoerythronate dehydrogenase [Corallincola luteus]
MRILVDENMPYARQLFSEFGQVEAISGRDLTPSKLKNVDGLMIRSVTKVNEALLTEANKLSFVGSATIGTDHVDKSLLMSRDISFVNAPGCNAHSVADYLISALFVLAQQHQFNLRDKTVAIIGVGNIGTRVIDKCEALGINYLLCDPFKAPADAFRQYVSLEEAARADIITFHVPLTRDGQYPTFHMVDEAFLSALNPGTVLVNASRGEVIDNKALYRVLSQGKQLPTVLDVWENEPHVMAELLPLVELATAHIAGYSLEGKARGTEMIYQAFADHCGRRVSQHLEDFLPHPEIAGFNLGQPPTPEIVQRLVHAVYDVRRDDKLFREHALAGKGFDWLRRFYPERRELSSAVITGNPSVTSLQLAPLYQLGFSRPD